mmetsp:Transcript_12589/g.18630  ORF Transcript_12589/g.18630 Transcript_12589/m.18630 type:complete len:207 (+) Transcript_12589:1693-2313(+)
MLVISFICILLVMMMVMDYKGFKEVNFLVVLLNDYFKYLPLLPPPPPVVHLPLLRPNQQQQQQCNRGRRSLPPLRSSRPRRISRHNPQTLRFLPHGPRRNHTRWPHSPPHRLPTRSTCPRCRLPPPPLSIPRQIQIQRDVVHPHPPRLLHQTRRLCGSHSCACHSESRCLCRAGSEREHTAAFGMPQSIFFPGSHSLHCGASSCCT